MKKKAHQRRAVGYTVGRAPIRRRKMNGAPRRRAMNGTNQMIDEGIDMAKVALGMLGYAMASKFVRQQAPEVSPHIINAGAGILAIVVGGQNKDLKPIATGFGAAAVGNSLLSLMPPSLMQGHTKKTAPITDRQREMIRAELEKARLKAHESMGSALNGANKIESLNGIDDIL